MFARKGNEFGSGVELIGPKFVSPKTYSASAPIYCLANLFFSINAHNPQGCLDAVPTWSLYSWSCSSACVGPLFPGWEGGHCHLDVGSTSWSNSLHTPHPHTVVY